jgi:hypothetical protein
MAKAAVLTIKKKKTVRVARRANVFALIPTDNFWKAKHFVQYEIESKEWINIIQQYISKHLDKSKAAAIAQVPEWRISYAAHWATAAYWLIHGHPLSDDYRKSFLKYLDDLAKEGQAITIARQEKAKSKKNLLVMSIQDRIQEQAFAVCEDIETWLESWVKDKKSFDPNSFDFKSHFLKHEISQAHARKIIRMYEAELAEARLIVSRPTPAQLAKIKNKTEKNDAEQLVEGYKHITKAQAQAYAQALENLINACTLIVDTSKAARKPRAKKTPSKEKVINKLKYRVNDDQYQLVSVNPLELIGCEELWVFNVRTRKLGKYVADESARVITVKGSTLIGYDEEKSIQKTLRKPSETLKEFKEAGKVKLRKFLDEIKTTDTKLNGRINEDTVLLKAVSK